MRRKLTPQSTIEHLRKEAKRWLKAVRAGETAARARLLRAYPQTPAEPTLRDVQLALAREHGFAGWSELRQAVADAAAGPGDARQIAVMELLAAAAAGSAARVEASLELHPDIIDERALIPGHTGLRTALHHAIRYADVVRILLDHGADPNIRDEGDYAMPLHFAAEIGDIDIIRMLIEHGADPIGTGDYHELDVIGWAAVFGGGKKENVDYLIAHGSRHNIFSAVAMSEVASIRAIAARAPADLDRPMDRTNHHRRPLHLAVVSKQPESLAVLLELGADPEATDEAGLTPLDQAALSGETAMVQALLAAGATVRLPAAIALHRMPDVERWLRSEPDALKPGQRWGTLIVRASEHAPGHIIETLIRLGASANATDNERTAIDSTARYTPLHAAAFNGNAEAVAVLLKHGADPNTRDSKYFGTPAGWANYAGHPEVRDLILAARIDPFQAIDFGLTDRITSIVQQEPWLLNKPFGEYIANEPVGVQWGPRAWQTPLAWAVTENRIAAVRALLEEGATQLRTPEGRKLRDIALAAGHDEVAGLLQQYERVDQTHAGRVRWFIRNTCPDHQVRGRPEHDIARGTAERLLRRYPEIAHDSFYTAIVCGDAQEVARVLKERPEAANQGGGPKGWSPLLYVCFTRLPSVAAASNNAVSIASLLLDHGADPNAFFMAGDSRYTPLVGVIGEGEENRPAHPQRDALTRLLLERGAEPYDLQVVYNIHFHGQVLWFLELIYERALQLGRQADWDDPTWSMLDMGGYGNGARWHFDIAVRHNDLALARWLLTHGASPNAPPAADPRFPKRSLYEEALRAGHTELAELLVRHGATVRSSALDAQDEFDAAALRLDRKAAHALAEAQPELLRSARVLVRAAETDRPEVVELLLKLGMSIELEDAQHQRALHVAAYHGSLRVARLLIDRGAEIDPVESSWHSTPLGHAVYAQRQPLIELLSRFSHDIWNLTFVGNVERVRDVLEIEPERAQAVNSNGSTPLMWLPDDEARALEIIELLLEHGADATIRNQEGMTAADYAHRRGLTEAAAILSAALSD